MRNYTPLNDNGRRAKAVLVSLLDARKAVREIETCIAQLDGEDGACVLETRLHVARDALNRAVERGRQQIARSPALSPAQVMILTLRYVRGYDWMTIARVTHMDRERLFQEHRTGLNGMRIEKKAKEGVPRRK